MGTELHEMCLEHLKEPSKEPIRITHRMKTVTKTKFSSVAQCPTLCDPMAAAQQASPSITNARSSPKLMSFESMMPSNHLILCHSVISCLQSFPESGTYESVPHIRWPKNWSFSFSISPSNEYWGLISFRMDWLDILAAQGTLKSLSNTTVQKYEFFSTQLYL